MNLNVTDLRKKYRRSAKDKKSEENIKAERRKMSDRRVLRTDKLGEPADNSQRVWLTPGEKTLIEDIYLLDEE
jgi:hypothetical protein